MRFANRIVFLFSRVNEGADDEAAESGIGIGVCIGIAVGFLAVVCVFLLPLSTEFGGVHDDRGLLDCLCERRNSLLARGRKRTFIRMLDYISMRATVAGTHDNLIGGTEFARHGVEGMRESSSSHRVRQSSRTDRFAVRPLCCQIVLLSERSHCSLSDNRSILLVCPLCQRGDKDQ